MVKEQLLFKKLHITVLSTIISWILFLTIFWPEFLTKGMFLKHAAIIGDIKDLLLILSPGQYLSSAFEIFLGNAETVGNFLKHYVQFSCSTRNHKYIV
jgi:hypothetical protein